MSQSKPIWLHQSHTLLATVGFVAALGVSPASAALFNTTNCVLGSISGVSPPNEVAAALAPTFGNPISGCFGSTITKTGTAVLKYEFFGYEAADDNHFLVDDVDVFINSNFTSPPIALNISSPLGAFFSTSLDFSFWDPEYGSFGNVASTVFNGDANLSQPKFFSSLLGASIALWFDDAGGGPDSDYDDMMVLISEQNEVPSPIPLPLSFPLFATGLAGLMWLRKRRTGPLSIAASNPT